MSSHPDSDDDAAAFADLAKRLPVETGSVPGRDPTGSQSAAMLPAEPEAEVASALADFVRSLPVESIAERRARREAGYRRVAKAIRNMLWCAPCVALGTTIAASWSRPQPVLNVALLALAAVVGAALGAVMGSLMTLLFYLRAEGGGTFSMLSGQIPTERIDPIPFFHWAGPPGAVIGCWLATLLVAKQVLNAPLNDGPPFFGGCAGAASYAMFRTAQWLFLRFHEPANRDRFDTSTP